MPAPDDPLHGLTVLERGWLSSNNLLIHATAGEPGAVLVDSGHVNHAAQTLALVKQALGGEPLSCLLNTHLHSDHCGGNAALQAAFDVPVAIPPGLAEAVRVWDDAALSYAATGQRMERFTPQAQIAPGELLQAGGRAWEVLAAPGHDPHSVMFFDRAQGVLVSADALWEHGFGVVFPEIDGEPGFDDVAAVLEHIATLPVRVVIPGHGRPFDDVAAALDRARSRIRGFQADPARHARHAVKVLVKYHLMEEQTQALDALVRWAVGTPLLRGVWERFPPAGLSDPAEWVTGVVADLVNGGALRRDGEHIVDG